jgi:hypothetical protein
MPDFFNKIGPSLPRRSATLAAAIGAKADITN